MTWLVLAGIFVWAFTIHFGCIHSASVWMLAPIICIAQAWHKLNFHMNCNLSIVCTQCLSSPSLITLNRLAIAWILVSLFEFIYRKMPITKSKCKNCKMKTQKRQIFLTNTNGVEQKITNLNATPFETCICLHFLTVFVWVCLYLNFNALHSHAHSFHPIPINELTNCIMLVLSKQRECIQW